jgi:hypothetical protein
MQTWRHPKRFLRLAQLAAVVGAFLGLLATSRAVVLTFDVFTDSGKTTTPANNSSFPQTYGDNVTDFDPAGIFGSLYYRYGSTGGYTPNTTIQYRYYDGTTTALQNPSFWQSGFGNLTNLISTGFGSAQQELRLVPSNGTRVTLQSFDLAGFSLNQTVSNISIVADLGTPSATILWGPFSNTLISGTTNTHFAPMVTVPAGHTLSLLFGPDASVLRGLDNLIFSEANVPEPSTIALLAMGGFLWWRRRRP